LLLLLLILGTLNSSTFLQ
jgi:hypothetical protein